MGANFDTSAIRDRLKEYLDAEGLNNRRFEQKCGLYNGFVKDLDTKIKFESLAKIAEGCPNLNLGWLFSGLGRMRIEDEPISPPQMPGVNLQNVFVTNFSELKEIMVEAIKESRR